MKRVIMIVLDSVGAGALPDADKYGDVGANTLGHIWEQAHPDLPYMEKMGLGRIEGLGYPVPEKTAGAFGRAMEVSAGKDTTTGHTPPDSSEMTPLPLFPPVFHCFPCGTHLHVLPPGHILSRGPGPLYFFKEDTVFSIFPQPRLELLPFLHARLSH